ncbi:MAG: phosphoribosyltransferase family protein [Xenococcaceae cyanobacterium MO_188.B19]|nr:phosphoribosyltransferase family protein [Xenococcaceae cyanobacterium MO_188.B19]
MSDLYVSWAKYHQNIERLAIKIAQSGWKCDRIVCLAKGGLRVGDILCRIFDKPLAILSCASYQNKTRGKLVFSEHLSMTESSLKGKILLVDDLVDSGMSLKAALAWLNQRYGAEITEIKTAVIWYKGCSIIAPDYYTDYLPDNPWIHQPFEKYEQLTIQELSNSGLD